jgi:hypothetical protein
MAKPGSDKLLTTLRVLAVLIALRSLMNLGKPFGTGSGLVFLGFLLTGPAMWVLAPALGIYMLVWTWGLWGLRSYAVPMGFAYLALVTVNLVGFPLTEGLREGITLPMYGVYALVAFGAPALALWLLIRLRAALPGDLARA